MGVRVQTAVRKKPTQGRARETIQILLDAAQEILIKEGYDRASTNRIAERAGISIGSVYQYFPNKESLYAAVIDRHCDEQLKLSGQLLDCSQTKTLFDAVRETVTAIFQAQLINPRLSRVIKEQVPRVGKLKRLDDTQIEVAKLVAKQIRARKSETSVKEIDLASLMIVKAVDAICCSSYLPLTAESEREKVIEELVHMVYAYITLPRVGTV